MKWIVTPGHIEKHDLIRYLGACVSTRVDFFETHMGDVEFFGASFGTIGYSPKNFLSSYLGFRPFFWFWFLARYSKTANFRDMVPTLRSTFFSISYKMAYFFFFFANFLKKRCMTQSLFSRTWTRSGGWKLTCDSLNIWIYPWRNFFTRHNDRSKNGGW